jgi:beta-glucosidase
VTAVKQGLLSEKDIDLSLKRLLLARFRLGMFDPAEIVPYAAIPITENDTPAHRSLALHVARESMVLLKNNGVLPLHKDVKTIAVVGPLADSERVLLGNYHAIPSRATTVLEGIRHQFLQAQVSFVPGTDFLNQYPVPTSVLSPGGGAAGSGLRGEYFAATEPVGTAVLSRIDPLVDFDFGESPMPSADGKRFSARWSGELVPDTSGTYQLGVKADDGFRLFLDGKLLVEDKATASHKLMYQPSGR